MRVPTRFPPGLLAALALFAASGPAAAVAAPPVVTELADTVPGARPVAVAAGADGNLWVAQRDVNLVARLSTGGAWTQIAVPAATDVDASADDIVSGPDGAMWFAQRNAQIGRITSSGVITQYPVPSGARPLATGPDGALWFVYGRGEAEHPAVGRMTTDGVLSEFVLPGFPTVGDMVAGPDGALWFTAEEPDQIMRITTAGVVTAFPLPADTSPGGISLGPDGALWFTAAGSNAIGRITTLGSITMFAIPEGRGPNTIAAGPDGALWFTEDLGNAIGRVTTSGAYTTTPIPTADSRPRGIVAGPDGAMWFAESDVGRVGRVVIDLPQTLQLDRPTASVAEGAGSVTATVTRAGGSLGAVTVAYATVAGTATAGQDFDGVSGTLTFGPGETTKTVTVPIVDDAIGEPAETFTIALSTPSGATISAPAATTLTIDDDDEVDTAITAGPSGPTNDETPEFRFAATPSAAVTLSCAIDDAAPSACTSPLTTAALGEGTHTFTVGATSSGGVPDPTPASRTFLVDTIAPKTSIAYLAAGPLAGSVGENRFIGPLRAAVTTVETGSGLSAVRCAFDPPRPPVRPADFGTVCKGTFEATGLHTAYAYAVDLAGNVEAPVASASAEIVTHPAPETRITKGPTGSGWDMAPSVTFTSSIPDSTFRCRVDGQAFSSCTSPTTASTLRSGEHLFEVYAVSPYGVTDPTPAQRSFGVNKSDSESSTCTVSPFLNVRAFDNHTYGCGVSSSGCEAHVACRRVPRCPKSAQCTLRVRSQWNDADTNLSWGTSGHTGFVSVPGRDLTIGASPRCTTGLGLNVCITESTASAFGAADVQATCTAFNASLRGLPNGPDRARRLTCRITIAVAPARSFSVLTSGRSSAQLLVPGPGLVAAFSNFQGVKLRAFQAKPAAPLFAPLRTRVKAAGPVTLKLRLTKAARKRLRRARRLIVPLRITFTPDGGGLPVTVARTITLRAPVA